MKPTVMISEVKFFSKRVNAFSLLEILIALVIVGVVISFPNWQSLITRLDVNNSAIKKELELKLKEAERIKTELELKEVERLKKERELIEQKKLKEYREKRKIEKK